MQVLTADQQQIRNAFLTGPKAKTELVEHNGFNLEVRQPTLGVRNRIYKAAQMGSADIEEEDEARPNGKPKQKVEIKFDLGKLQLSSVIACTYFPGTEQRAFSEHDYQTLSDQLAGGGIDKLVSAAMTMINVKEGVVAKKSEPTPSESSPTSSP
jgi:hypothetical protein